MEHEFWYQAWKERKIGFHRKDYHPQLIEGIQKLKLQENSTILVPLCGKSLDLIYLKELGHHVTGVELSTQAIEEFNEENKQNPHASKIKLISGDFFSYKPESTFQLIYDRAALVALPKKMRANYAKKNQDLLSKGGKIILISFEYDQDKISGPPHSVETDEIEKIYDQCSLEIFHKKTDTPNSPRFIESKIDRIIQKSYILTKN